MNDCCAVNYGEWLLLLSYYFGRKCIIIKNKYFEDYEEFVCNVLDTVNSLEDFEDVSIIAKYNHANQIIKELLCIGANIASIELHKEELEEYYDEYIISITKDENGEPEVWCEKFKREKGYLTDDSTVMYVMDDCSSKVIPYFKGKTVYEVSVGIEEPEESDCETCDLYTNDSESTYISRTKDGKIAGFSKSWSTSDNGITCYSSYSHYGSDEDMVKKIARDFGINI